MENDQNHPVPFGKYQILEELGRGGFGIVYHAFDTVLEREVAIKELYPNLVNDPAFVSRFKQEARIAAKLDHPNLVPVHDFGQIDGKYYLAMGYMAGGSLKDLLKQEGPLSKERALKIIQQVGAGLAYAYDQGVIHRDLKPGNILFDAKGQARVSDLDFAKLLHSKSSSSMSTSGGLVGTPAYMAPEIWRGKGASAATDVYSLVCILVEMLTARSLFDGESTPEIMFKHFEPLQLPEDLPDAWMPVIEQGLEKKPEERIGDVDDLISRLQQAEQLATLAVPDQVKSKKQDEQKEPGQEAEKQPVLKKSESRGQPAKEKEQNSQETEKNPDQPSVEVSEDLSQLADPISAGMQQSKSRFTGETPNILKNKTPLYLNLGVLVLLAIFLIVRSGIFSARQQSTAEPVVVVIQDTATKQPDPTETPTQIPTRTNTPQPTKTATPIPKPTSTPSLGIGSTKVREQDRMEMVYVPAGEFAMGNDEWSIEDEKPVRQIYLDAYWIDKFEVTNEQYALCVAEGACGKPVSARSWTRDSYYGDPTYSHYPVIFVNWYQAQDYCKWVGGELPTEAQWEKAAGGTDGNLYSWGNDPPKSSLANYDQNRGDTTEVGTYPDGASYYDVQDMTGNVREWVRDWYGAYDPDESDNPTGSKSGQYRVTRGGGWLDDWWNIRVAHRSYYNPTNTSYHGYIGFRCVSPP